MTVACAGLTQVFVLGVLAGAGAPAPSSTTAVRSVAVPNLRGLMAAEARCIAGDAPADPNPWRNRSPTLQAAPGLVVRTQVPRQAPRRPLPCTHDLSSHRPPPRERRLQLRLRSRRGQARAPDQLLLPQPRRGDVRRVPASDGRHRFEELPHDRARGSRRRQDQVPVPLGGTPAAMARILLGVSGGIAAYKALELVPLAPGAGHAVRTIQTPASQRFTGAASFAALTGAPVLTDEFERDPARGAFPGQAMPDHEPLSHLELVRNADVFAVAPATANTIAKLAT